MAIDGLQNSFRTLKAFLESEGVEEPTRAAQLWTCALNDYLYHQSKTNSATGGDDDVAAPATMTAAELLNKELPPVSWTVPGILPEGVGILAGKPKLGKSWLALGLCVSVAHGGYALGTKPVEQGESLYLALEDNERRLQARLKQMVGDNAPAGMHVQIDWPRMNDGGLSRLDNWLADHPDCRLVVIDTLAMFKPQTGGGRNAYDVDRDALDPLVELAGRYGVSILCVHHMRKMAASDPLDEINSSTGLTASADTIITLKRDRGRGDAYLYATGRDLEEEADLALTWNGHAMTWTIAGDAEEYRAGEKRVEDRRVLAEAGEPLTAKAVSEATGDDYNATRQRLYQSSKSGELKAVGGGKYTLPNSPNSPNFTNAPNSPNSGEVLGSTPGPNSGPNSNNPHHDGENGTTVRDVRDVREDGELLRLPRHS